MKKIKKIICHILSSKYGNEKVFGQPKKVRSFVIVEVQSSNGISGFGESYQSAYLPEISKFIIDYLSKYFLNLEINFAIKKIENFRIPFVSQVGIIKGLLSSLEIAILDAKAKSLGVPFFKILNKNSKRKKIKAYASGGSVIYKKKDLIQDINLVKELGFSSYKMRIGHYKFNEDLKRINFIKNNLKGIDIMIDAIMGTLNLWNFKIAKKRINILNKIPLKWIEEPLPPERIFDYKKLKVISKNSIALGESFTNYYEFENAIKNNSCDIIQPDVTQLGIRDTIKVIKLAKKFKKSICLHVWGSPISLLCNLHVALAFKEISLIEYPLVSLEFLKNDVSSKLKISNSFLSLKHEESGLGISIDKKILKKFNFIKLSGFEIK